MRRSGTTGIQSGTIAFSLSTLLLYHLVERSGGQVQFKLEDAHRVKESLSTKMVQMQVGDEIRLRIINRLPELQ